MFAYPLFTLGLAATALALPYPTNSSCREIKIPVTVSVPRFIVNATVNDDWDVVALTLNLTRRDFTNPTDPLPMAGTTAAPVKSTFTVGATLCGTGGPLLVLTHGIIESKLYFNPNFENSKAYNFVEAAVAAGYSVLNYDRIGVGSSSKVDAVNDAQFQVEAAVLDALIDYGRKAVNASKVALVGHSYGSYLTVASAASKTTAIDAIVLTGFAGGFTYFTPFLAGSGFRVAKHANPLRWGSLDPGYLTSVDLYAETYVYFGEEQHFERRVAEWSHYQGSEPFAVGELPSLLASSPLDFAAVTAPVLVIQGQFDLSACGGNCVGLLDGMKDTFSGAKAVETVDNLPSGHNLNLHKVAPQAFKTIFDFLKRQGV
ncbi:alpha/beta-hydrolase [Annulohypoxylon truncatum]|uniref:alpha/beta-hydrolase n=1 Tax=Annulohypoxylon truncatum TaxID=327061 RepID=UPI002007E6D5|nr:alpha/beta-hydrolase [Annulohypoxylon truncatum]KAI1207617.1 alpha/beta-hydrolase [Annulohypoxylon truncatum]